MINTVAEWALLIVFAIFLIAVGIIFIPVAMVMIVYCALRGDFVDEVDRNF